MQMPHCKVNFMDKQQTKNLPFSRLEHGLLSIRGPIIDTNYYFLCQVIASHYTCVSVHMCLKICKLREENKFHRKTQSMKMLTIIKLKLYANVIKIMIK